MHQLLRDLRFAFRALLRQPGLAIISILAFGLGIGLTTTMYSIVHGALLDLPFPESDRLMHLERSHLARGIDSMEVTYHDYYDWKEQLTSFDGLGAFSMGTANLSGSEGKPERFDGAFMTANCLDLIGVPPLLGRTFRPDEDGPGADSVVVIGHAMWQSRFHGDDAVLGETIKINGIQRTIIGVMPEGFEFPVDQDLWLLLEHEPASLQRGDGETLEVFGRLKQGVTQAAARTELEAVTQRLAVAYPDTNEGIGGLIKPYTREFVGEQAYPFLYTMLAAVFGVLLIACANVANLLLARTAMRSREVAVRSALGAGRWRIIRQLLTEVLLLAAGGAVLGLGIAWVGIGWFSRDVSQTGLPFWLKFELNLQVLFFALGLTLMAALIAGLMPALKVTGKGMGDVLKDQTRGGSSLRLGRFSKALVVAEIALSCCLLVAAGLMIQTVVNFDHRDLGFERDGVFTARIGLFESDYPEEDTRREFWRELERRVEELPAVASASLTTSLPGLGSGSRRIALEGEAYPDEDQQPAARWQLVTPGYFETFGVEMVAGRPFSESDREGQQPVTIVNRSFAERHFSGEDPVGRRLRIAGGDEEQPWLTIVGVVPDLYMEGVGNTMSRSPAGFYVPVDQHDARFLSLAARGAGGSPMALTEPVRAAVSGIDPDLPIYWVRSMDETVDQAGWFFSTFGSLFAAFGLTALFLAAIGLYGVMSFAVGRRTQEVGIRMALGARSGQVLRLILRQGVWQLAIGLVLGLLLALPLARGIRLVLFEVDPWDPAIFALITAVLAATGLAACLIPARRAAQVHPATALRSSE